ncbi:RNA 2',3'-cyclic phosphodiesterase [Pararhodonellum marinum]|uniref:RNA 2',3'-cyclic phosphodiesterase n=1 Tax=Pararhodonellum marinum TaxID=2755358 RepID=UPI00189064CB|nr:RNA 2',3'-cyclic phosphodiesterase [Pararhodonellum marinum]
MPAKYFIAVVPEAEIREAVNRIKLEIREKFNAKYALNSPPHITLKMPFTWDERREQKLMVTLEQFFVDKPAFELVLEGVGHFGNRVVYLSVKNEPQLISLQKEVSHICKTKLLLNREMSDQIFKPHMTVAYRDLKTRDFQPVLEMVKDMEYSTSMWVNKITLLKRKERIWEIWKTFKLSG